MASTQKGFTLTELLIVLAIIGLIYTFAHPSYTHHRIRLKRSEGKQALLHNMILLEQHYLQAGTYAEHRDAPDSAWSKLPQFSTDNPQRAAYKISMHPCIVNAQTLSYSECAVLKAIPHAAFIDSVCETLILRSDGFRSAGPEDKPNANFCWEN